MAASGPGLAPSALASLLQNPHLHLCQRRLSHARSRVCHREGVFTRDLQCQAEVRWVGESLLLTTRHCPGFWLARKRNTTPHNDGSKSNPTLMLSSYTAVHIDKKTQRGSRICTTFAHPAQERRYERHAFLSTKSLSLTRETRWTSQQTACDQLPPFFRLRDEPCFSDRAIGETRRPSSECSVMHRKAW